MKNVNWDNVQDEVRRPVPDGYIAQITRVEDVEDKEYLRIEWDFFEGEFKGANQETYDTFGFWPITMICSYKDKALRFFKGFKTAVEMSNRNYVFRNDPQSLVGKCVGVVLGEEEYLAGDGKVKKRLYVAEKRSGRAIRDGDFKVPAFKPLAKNSAASNYSASSSAPTANFAELEEDDAELPF